MKTYLIPVDFSEAAFNAANFAVKLSHQTDVARIILMNAYYISQLETMLPDTNMMMVRQEEIEENAADRIKQLETLKAKISKHVRQGVEIVVSLKQSHLVRAVVDEVNRFNADLVILGSVGNSTVRENSVGIGSHVVEISRTSPAPVIVVPPLYNYKLIDEAVIACDFKNVKENMPMDILHKLLGKQNIKLLVVNVNEDGRNENVSENLAAEQAILHDMLQAFNPEYFYINNTNVISGILDFAAEHKAQMVIVLPHTYGFLKSILHNSISQQLAKSSTVPVLLLK